MSKRNLKSNNIRFAILAVDVVCFRIYEGKLQILLGKVTSKENPFNNMWAHIGGLVKVEETAEDSLKRLLKEKAGISKIYHEQLYTFSDIGRDPRGRVVSVAYIALTSNLLVQDLKKSNIETMWVNIDKIPKLSYDHNKILTVAVDRLKSKIIYTDMARYFLGNEFTLSELQTVYELVLEEKLDKRNFRKKFLNSNLILDSKKKVKNGTMRPAVVYQFK